MVAADLKCKSPSWIVAPRRRSRGKRGKQNFFNVAPRRKGKRKKARLLFPSLCGRERRWLFSCVSFLGWDMSSDFVVQGSASTWVVVVDDFLRAVGALG